MSDSILPIWLELPDSVRNISRISALPFFHKSFFDFEIHDNFLFGILVIWLDRLTLNPSNSAMGDPTSIATVEGNGATYD